MAKEISKYKKKKEEESEIPVKMSKEVLRKYSTNHLLLKAYNTYKSM